MLADMRVTLLGLYLVPLDICRIYETPGLQVLVYLLDWAEEIRAQRYVKHR